MSDSRMPALLEEAIRQWGEEAQYGMAIEEIGELLTVLNHHWRGRATIHDVAEEIADVQIMLVQLSMMLCDGGPGIVEMKRHEKLDRLEKRLYPHKQN